MCIFIIKISTILEPKTIFYERFCNFFLIKKTPFPLNDKTTINKGCLDDDKLNIHMINY